MSVRVWRIDREAIWARLTRWASELAQDDNVLAVVLFGSLARGDHTGASDADVLILLGHSSCRFDQRIPSFLPTGIGIGVDVFPYTLEEAARAVEERWGVVEVALREGLPLFERREKLGRLRSLLGPGFEGTG